jgi:signal transduction histidine kinase
VHLAGEPGTVRLSVTDDGHGLERSTDVHGVGLRIMRYRAQSIGATLTVDSTAAGTVVTCVLREAPPQITQPISEG